MPDRYPSREQDGKMVSYYVADNDVAKAFHENVCKEAKKVTATGTVAKVDGKERDHPVKN